MANPPRDRYRAQVRAEIKTHARNQIATTGPSALSLNAIAKQMGLSGPALYRYYKSRDDLITDLITDAYRSLADAVQGAGSAADPAVALRALAHTIRTWALEDPHRYFLIYGTPVPGYHAPPETTAISSEIMAAILAAVAALDPAPTAFGDHLADHRDWAVESASPAVLHRALSFWTRIHGVLSLELAGHFAGMGFDSARLFDAEVAGLVGA